MQLGRLATRRYLESMVAAYTAAGLSVALGVASGPLLNVVGTGTLLR
jgi:hypothetical protein